MNKNSRTLTKISENQYMLSMDDVENRLHQEKGYSKHELKEAYESLKLNTMQTKQSLEASKKSAAAVKVVITPEEKKMLDIMEKAAKHVEYQKLEKQIIQQEKDYNMYSSQMKEIEMAIHEVKRAKK